jgi:hypothetical protein
MVALKLVRLIERHSEELVQGLAEQIRTSERMCSFRNIPPADLELAAAEVYRNLGEWLLQKTEEDIERRFGAIAARRAAEQISLHQFVWALIVSRDHLWRFLQREAFACNVVELYGELELHQMLTQFFDRAVYYGILAYGMAEREDRGKSILSSAATSRQARLDGTRPFLQSVQGKVDE